MEIGKQSHPLVIHSEEEHNGRKLKLLMRVVRQSKTALERQIWESVAIDSLYAKDSKGCLNGKNEQGHSKNTSLGHSRRPANLREGDLRAQKGGRTVRTQRE